MLSKGDYVVYGNHGVCRVRDILVPPFLDAKKEKLYYMMVSTTDLKSVLYVPVEGAEQKMREVLDPEEAEGLLDTLEGMEALDLSGGKKAEGKITEIVKQNAAREMLRLVKSLYRVRALRAQEGKKFAAMNERYLIVAEKLLYSELAFSLGIGTEEIRRRVQETLSGLPLEA